MSEKRDFRFDKKAAKYDDSYEGKLSEKFYTLVTENVQLKDGIPETLRRAGRPVRQGQGQTDRSHRSDCRAESPKASDRILPERAARLGAVDGVPGYRLAGDGELHHRSQQGRHPGDPQGRHRDQSITP